MTGLKRVLRFDSAELYLALNKQVADETVQIGDVALAEAPEAVVEVPEPVAEPEPVALAEAPEAEPAPLDFLAPRAAGLGG